MRDYKNVKVPRRDRSARNRVTVKRAVVRRAAPRQGVATGQIKTVMVALLAAVVIAAGSWLGWQAYRTVMRAELFQIAGVDVRGAKQLGEAELKKIAGAFTGENIFRVDLDAAVRRAQANPWIKSVSISRSLPNRVSMVVTERIPHALLETAAGRFLMDSEGFVIERLVKETAGAWPLPVIGTRDCRIRFGEQASAEALGEALKLLSEIAGQGGWRLEDVYIRANTPESLAVVYADHEFKIGSTRYAEKLRRLSEVMADVKQRDLQVAYVDLRSDRQVAVLSKNASSKSKTVKSRGKKG